ncbi:MAG: serine/threonine-protein kinase [Kofleriaceae bacterium]
MVDDGEKQTQHAGYAATLLTPPTGVPITAAGSSSSLRSFDTERYQLRDVIGQGGMGEVVLAVDGAFGREVAVKRVRREKPGAEEYARFVREAKVQGRLDHPAVVPVHDLAMDANGRPLFVMKKLVGTEMKALLERVTDDADPVAARRRLLRAFADVCLAVEFAHSRGIVHRDLKPSNIMLGDFGEVYVIDWGIARAIADPGDEAVSDEARDSARDLALATGDTRAGTVMGTPAYMAPEQLLGLRVGIGADIYALGCILFEIAAGDQLHRGARTIASALNSVDARPSQRRADSPPELDAICVRATSREIAARFGSARALGAAVQAFLDGDRDVAARKELAQHHITEARAAIARGDGEDDRRAAMRAAGRALALDPTANEAADLVSRLVLAPPRKVPAEVERQLEAIDIANARTQGRMGAIAITGYLWFLPLLWWTGIRDAAVVLAFGTAALASAGQVWFMSRRTTIPTAGIYVSAIINAILIAVICRIVGPFVVAPTLVLTTLMAFAVHPRFGNILVVAAILTGGVAVPWILEIANVLSPTYTFANGTIILSSNAVAFTPMPVLLAFGTVLVLLAVVVAVLLRSMATRQREATMQIEVQSWHLRQLVAR